jgi:hypothetical protein
MDIRIEELYNQSVLYTMNNCGRRGQASSNMMCAEKFAELIILKCVDICEEYGEIGSGETLAAEILIYFGDEE